LNDNKIRSQQAKKKGFFYRGSTGNSGVFFFFDFITQYSPSALGSVAGTESLLIDALSRFLDDKEVN